MGDQHREQYGKKTDMSALLNELKAWGCDTDSVMPHFSHKEDFYARCFKKFVVDPALEALGKALADKDADAAFRQAHTLKGLTENMGLTPLSAILSRIVEPLRLGNCDQALSTEYRKFIREVKRYKILAVRDGV